MEIQGMPGDRGQGSMNNGQGMEEEAERMDRK